MASGGFLQKDMKIDIPEEYAGVVLLALKERAATLSTRSILLPTRYPLSGKTAEEMNAISSVIGILELAKKQADGSHNK